MDFALSEQQRFLQQTVSELLNEQCSLDVVRADAENSTTKNDRLYNALAEIGVPGVLIPEDFGGIELSLLDASLVAESIGSVVGTVPYIGSMVIAPIALIHGGSDSQQNEWLPKIASGEVTVGVALGDHVGARDNDAIVHSSNKLSGRAMFAMDTQSADVLLISAHSGELYLVDPSEVAITELKTIDKTRSVAEITLSGAACEQLAEGDESRSLLGRVLDAGRVAIAADTLGAAQTMLIKAIAYAGERTQFKRVIGSFQAVKHMCAEMASELEPCRSLVWYAAHAFSAIPDESHLTASHAKAHLSEVGRFVARKATEVHGGMGFTDLLGLHYWFKRIELNRQLLGTPEFIRNEAAKAQGWV